MAVFMEMSAIISRSTALRATARALDALLRRDIEGVSTLRYSQMIISVGKKYSPMRWIAERQQRGTPKERAIIW
jgi:hypothetical protein